MPSSVSRTRRQKAFNDGRRSALNATARNPYDNPKLHELWESGRAKQAAGELKIPIPPLDHGETRSRPANPKRPTPNKFRQDRDPRSPRRN